MDRRDRGGKVAPKLALKCHDCTSSANGLPGRPITARDADRAQGQNIFDDTLEILILSYFERKAKGEKSIDAC